MGAANAGTARMGANPVDGDAAKNQRQASLMNRMNIMMVQHMQGKWVMKHVKSESLHASSNLSH